MNPIVEAPPAPKRYRAFKIVGDSMVPTYLPTETVMVDTCDTVPSPPGTFVVWEVDGLAAKRIQCVDHSGRVRVSTDNPTYAAYEAPATEIEIHGRIVGKWQFV